MAEAETRRRRLFIVVGAVALALALFAGVYVWPTAYRYDHLRTSAGATIPVRINRFTGHAEFLGFSGWVQMEPNPPKVSPQ
jgi:hypothetical protein